MDKKTKAKMEKEEAEIRKKAEAMEKEERRKEKEAAKMKKETSASPGKAPAKAVVDPNSQLWTSRYAPTSLKDICGNKGQVEKLRNWLHDWCVFSSGLFLRQWSKIPSGRRASKTDLRSQAKTA